MTKAEIQNWKQNIFQDNPDIARDPLKKYYVEQMCESYAADAAKFNKSFKECLKKERKNKLEVQSKLPEEIICITKKEGENTKSVGVDKNGYIKVS